MKNPQIQCVSVFFFPLTARGGLGPNSNFFFSVTVDSYHNYSWPLHNFKNHGKDYFTSQLKHSAPPSSFFVPYAINVVYELYTKSQL